MPGKSNLKLSFPLAMENPFSNMTNKRGRGEMSTSASPYKIFWLQRISDYKADYKTPGETKLVVKKLMLFDYIRGFLLTAD